jgi:hypothetical protein
MSIVGKALHQSLVAAGLRADPPPAASPQTPLREAVGVTVVDADDGDWRPLNGRSDKDLSPLRFERALKLSYYVWNQNPLGNRLIELPLAYLLGKGIALKVPDDDAQAVLDRHWTDPINAWNIKLYKRLRELSISGEMCLPAFVGGNGFVRIGYIDPEWIETVVQDPENSEQSIGVVLRPDKRGRRRKYKVIVNGPETVFAERTREIRSEYVDGECFYFRINDLCTGRRGRGDLVPVLDWLDAYDQYLFGELDGADYRRKFIWDVTLKGANKEEVERRAKEIAAPSSGDTRVHNENETWAAVSPDLQAEDAQVGARLFRNHILGGLTLPEHWFGGAAEVNRSTGDSMAEPTEKMFEVRQTLIGHFIVEIGRFVLRAEWGLLDVDAEPSKAQADLLAKLRVEWPEMTTKDTTRYAAALQQVVLAVQAAIEDGLLTDETALRLIAALAEQLGVEIDVEKELADARKALSERGGGGADLMGRDTPAIDDTTLPSDAAAQSAADAA